MGWQACGRAAPLRRRAVGVAVALAALAVTGCGPRADGTRGETRVEVFDFARRFDEGDYRRECPGHDFDAGGAPHRLSGWSTAETDAGGVSFVWAVGRESTLALPMHRVHAAGVRWLHFRAWAPDLGADAEQRLTVHANGAPLGSVQLDRSARLYALPAPAGVLAAGDNRLRFVFARTRRPDDRERRALAAAFDFVTASPVSEPAAAEAGARRARAPGADGAELVLPGDSSLTFSLRAPERGALAFVAASGDDSLLGAELVVRDPSAADGGERVVWSGRSAGATEIDLSEHAGRDVDIVFRALGDPAGSAAWTSPRLLGDTGATNLSTNVVLIVVDTLRADHLGAYGGAPDTPNMDALAASGVRFERAYSPVPITGPAHASLFTSLPPGIHGVRNNLQRLPSGHVTLSELLRGAWRRTAAFVSLGVIRAPSGLDQGFDEYFDEFPHDWWRTARDTNDQLLPWLARVRAPFFLWAHYSDPHEPYASPDRVYPSVTVTGQAGWTLETVADGTTVAVPLTIAAGAEAAIVVSSAPGAAVRPIRLRNLGVQGGGPDIAYVCAGGCDGPPDNRPGVAAAIRVRNQGAAERDVTFRFAPSESTTTLPELRKRYAEEVEYVDRRIGDLLAALARAGRRDDTLVILTADHGEGLGDHGYLGHVGALHQEQLLVPLILSWPGRLPAGETVEMSVSLLDLLPTVTDLLSIRDDVPRLGRSLAPLIERAPGSDVDVPIVARTFTPQAPADLGAIITGDLKLIADPSFQEAKLYDLARDPRETRNGAQDQPARVAELAGLMMAQLARAPRGVPAGVVLTEELTDEQLRRLRSLGYVR